MNNSYYSNPRRSDRIGTVQKMNKDLWERWFRERQKKVVLKFGSEAELLDYYHKAKDKIFVAVLISDAVLTQIEPGTNTAVGIGPITGELPLY